MIAEPVVHCDSCREFCRRHPWDGRRHVNANLVSPIRCAFDVTGKFYTPNWNCQSLDSIRDAAMRNEVHNEDQNLAILKLNYGFLVVGYYKHRGETEVAMVVEGSEVRPLCLADIAEMVAVKLSQ